MRGFLIVLIILILAFVAWAFFVQCGGKTPCTTDQIFPPSEQPVPEPTPDPTPDPEPTPDPQPDPQPDPTEPPKDPNGNTFLFEPAGKLLAGSGTGVETDTIYAPGMRYPTEVAPSFPNSQVYMRGGYLGPAGGQCDAENYSYPWRDNFCEKRNWDTPICSSAKGHQGQDIRPATCKKGIHWAVAAEAGQITSIGSYTLTLTAASGIRYRYLHLKMDALAVALGDTVTRGQRIGLVSNDFGGSPTTIHLHFEIKTTVLLPNGTSQIHFAPPYTSLVDSYKRLLKGTP
jgi:murein DD-endopeptidase MepM/ murein hydrolase activator NlpD